MEQDIVIGSGFAGLSAACYMAKAGKKVLLLEKNEGPGGRASVFQSKGYTFDMGPSWYWMPDVFESFFNDFGKSVQDYYQLDKLSPAYRIFFDNNDIVDIPSEVSELLELFESIEPGAKKNLKAFLKDAAYKYDRGINDLVNKPALSVMEFASPKLVKDLFQLELFSSVEKAVHKRFKNDKLRKILEFPAYFLGATPNKIPALYTLMNHADLALGTWYPKGGMHQIIQGMVSLAKELGVQIQYHANVESINVQNGEVDSLTVNGEMLKTKSVIAAADYHHVEQKLLLPDYRQYTEKYWDKQTLAPSSLIFYLGINKKIPGLLHHNLFFDQDFKSFGSDIYEQPKWPNKPLFYACCPSKTDNTIAPEGSENLFLLMPAAPGLNNTTELEEKYFQFMITQLEKYTGESIMPYVEYRRAFAQNEFKTRYNSYKGNAYGLANTLMQTAFFKPKMSNPKIKNLAYAGQLTVPGPGVPPSLISGRIASEYLINKLN